MTICNWHPLTKNNKVYVWVSISGSLTWKISGNTVVWWEHFIMCLIRLKCPSQLTYSKAPPETAVVQSQLSITCDRQTSSPIVFLYDKHCFKKKISLVYFFSVPMAGLDVFGRDFDGLVPKMSQHFLCTRAQHMSNKNRTPEIRTENRPGSGAKYWLGRSVQDPIFM